MNVYDLSRVFWDYAFENPERIKPNHIAMYFFAIEHCNRLGWKDKFGFPTTMVMDAISIKSYNTYIKTLTDLVEFGFIKMVERSKNQYSANIIALSKFNKANNKALDKAMIKHCTKQSESTIQSISESTVQSIDSIDKPIYNITNLPIYKFTNTQEETPPPFQILDEVDKNISEEEKEKSCAKKEKDVLEYLNLIGGKNFKSSETNLKFIRARLKNNPIEVLKQVIEVKAYEWKEDAKMNMYLRPETLFNPTKFESYAQQVIEIKKNPQKFKLHVEQRNTELRKSAAKHYDPLDAMPD